METTPEKYFTKAYNEIIEEAKQDHEKGEFVFKQVSEMVFNAYIRELENNQLWTPAQPENPEIYAFYTYSNYCNFVLQEINDLKADIVVLIDDPAFIFDMLCWAVIVLNKDKSQQTTIRNNQKKSKRVLCPNDELTAKLIKINTRNITKLEENEQGEKVCNASLMDLVLSSGEEVKLNIEIKNWCNGFPLFLYLAIYTKLKFLLFPDSGKQDQRVENKGDFIVEQGLEEAGHNLITDTQPPPEQVKTTELRLTTTEILAMLDQETTHANIKDLRDKINTAKPYLRGLKYVITGRYHGDGFLFNDIWLDTATDEYVFYIHPILKRMAYLGAYFPLPNELFKIDCRNQYAHPIYIKLCEQINCYRNPKLKWTKTEKLTGYKFSIKVKTLLQGVGLDEVYKREKHLPQLKQQLTGALKAIARGVDGFDWAFTEAGLKSRAYNEFIKGFLCFNLPQAEEAILIQNLIE